MKNNKGITLVALVITIIVLLILAGVSISLVVGENGVLSRATGASAKSKRGQLIEAMDLALEDCQTQYVNDKYADEKAALEAITPKAVARALQKNKYNLFDDNNDTTTTGTTDGSWNDSDEKQQVFYVGAKDSQGKDRLAVKVLVVTKNEDGTDKDYPQIYTSYNKELGAASTDTTKFPDAAKPTVEKDPDPV